MIADQSLIKDGLQLQFSQMKFHSFFQWLCDAYFFVDTNLDHSENDKSDSDSQKIVLLYEGHCQQKKTPRCGRYQKVFIDTSRELLLKISSILKRSGFIVHYG